jgi:signal transduction histidine kinase
MAGAFAEKPDMIIRPIRWGLSAQLLVLTISFILLAEIFIFVPSIARFRHDWLQDKVDQAYLIALAARSAPAGMVTPDIETQVLNRLNAELIHVDLTAMDGITPMTIRMERHPPPANAATQFNLYDNDAVTLINDALMVLLAHEDRLITLMARPTNSKSMVTLITAEQPLANAARAFGWRILGLSLVISIMAGGMVFISLNRLLVRPIRRITNSMIAFRNHPEASNNLMIPSPRRDELGRAEQELQFMQLALRDALHQKTRLAMLGTGLAKINHDLRNILSSAALLSERLSTSRDQQVIAIAPRLETAIDRAITLCQDTLAFARDGRIPIRLQIVDLVPLLTGIGQELNDEYPARQWMINGAEQWKISVDLEQFQRVILNLGHNSYQAGAERITLTLAPNNHSLLFEDNGAGLPPRARDFLFVPFAASARAGGTGLGLALARDIMRAHGGDLSLISSDADGTIFQLRLNEAVHD